MKPIKSDDEFRDTLAEMADDLRKEVAKNPEALKEVSAMVTSAMHASMLGQTTTITLNPEQAFFLGVFFCFGSKRAFKELGM